MGDSGPASEDPVFLYIEKVHHFANEAAIAYTTCRKRNRAHFERLVKDNASMAVHQQQAVQTVAEVRAEIKRLEGALKDENLVAQELKHELNGMKDRVRDAAGLEEQNSQLGSSILALREELAKAEVEVNELHEEILRVAENHTKKSRRSIVK